MSYWTSSSTHKSNFQTTSVLVVRFLKGEGEDEGVVGKVMLVNGEVKRNDGGKTRIVMECKTEDERVEALREDFGITLTEEEKCGVRGRNVELAG